MVPAAAPTLKKLRATSWPAPISTILPYCCSFKLIDNTKSTGSRDSGLRMRRIIRNLYEMDNTKKISIDMNEVAIMSSSFADELFGKLVKEIGFMRFNQNFTITNVSSTNSNLIERAISQRMSYKE